MGGCCSSGPPPAWEVQGERPKGLKVIRGPMMSGMVTHELTADQLERLTLKNLSADTYQVKVRESADRVHEFVLEPMSQTNMEIVGNTQRAVVVDAGRRPVGGREWEAVMVGEHVKMASVLQFNPLNHNPV